MECFETPEAQQARFQQLLKATPSVQFGGRSSLLRIGPAIVSLSPASQPQRQPCKVCLTNDAVLVLSTDKSVKLLATFMFESATVDSMAPSCRRLRLAVQGGAVTLAFSTAAEKVAWAEAITDCVLGAAPADVQLEQGWQHSIIRGSLHAVAKRGAVKRVRALCRLTPLGRDLASSRSREADSDDDEDTPRGLRQADLRGSGTTSDEDGDCDSCAGRSRAGTMDETGLPEVDVDAVDDSGCTPLHYAVLSGSAGAVGVLLQHGASMAAMDSDCNTPLHLAVMAGDAHVAAVLLANGSPVDARNLLEMSPMALALSACKKPEAVSELVELLLGHGADANEVDGEGLSPMHRLAVMRARQAAGHNNGKGQAHDSEDHDGRHGLYSPETIEKVGLSLCKRGADANGRALLRAGPAVAAPVDGEGQASDAATSPDSDPRPPSPADRVEDSITPLHLACGLRFAGDPRDDTDRADEDNGLPAAPPVDVDVVRVLLACGAQPNQGTSATGETPLHLVLRAMDAVKRAAAGGPAPTPEQLYASGGVHPAALAAQVCLAAAHVLASNGARLDLPDARGVTCAALAQSLGVRNGLEASASTYVSIPPPPGSDRHMVAIVSEANFLAPLQGGKPSMGPGAGDAGRGAGAGTSGAGAGQGTSFLSRLSSLGKSTSASTQATVSCTACSTEIKANGPLGMGNSAGTCAWCSARVCGACSRKRFPVPGAGQGGFSPDIDADDDNDDLKAELQAAKQAASALAGAGKAQLSKLGAMLSASLQASVPPPGSGSGIGPAAAPQPASSGISGPAPARPPATSMGTTQGRKVCDGCFNRLRFLCEARAREQAAFEAQAAAHAATARNMRGDKTEASGGGSKPVADTIAAARAAHSRMGASTSAAGGSAARPGGPEADATNRAALFGSKASAAGGAAEGGRAVRASNDPSAVSGRLSGLSSVMEGNKARLAQRGEKMSRLAEVTGEMADDARAFESAAQKLKAKYASPFGWLGM